MRDADEIVGYNKKDEPIINPPNDDLSKSKDEDERNFQRPEVRTKIVHRGDVGLNQYNLPTHVYGLNVNWQLVTFPLRSELQHFTTDLSHLRYQLNGEMPKVYDLVSVKNRAPAMILGSYGANNIFYKHTIPEQNDNIIKYNDKILIKFLWNDVEVDTQLKYCSPILEPTPQHESLYEMYKLKLLHGGDLFNDFINGLARTVEKLSFVFQRFQEQNPGLHPLGYSEKQQLTLQFALSTVVTDFLSTFPPSLQRFVEKFLKDYKAEVGRGHSIAGR